MHDALDAWNPEGLPVRKVGRLVLDRNPDNFFAETEQVAYCPANIVPGIGFSEDPLGCAGISLGPRRRRCPFSPTRWRCPSRSCGRRWMDRPSVPAVRCLRPQARNWSGAGSPRRTLRNRRGRLSRGAGSCLLAPRQKIEAIARFLPMQQRTKLVAVRLEEQLRGCFAGHASLLGFEIRLSLGIIRRPACSFHSSRHYSFSPSDSKQRITTRSPASRN
jgi:hypothetical protein